MISRVNKSQGFAERAGTYSDQVNKNPTFESTESYSSIITDLNNKLSEVETLLFQLPQDSDNTMINNFITTSTSMIFMLKDGLQNVKGYKQKYDEMKNRFNSQQSQTQQQTP